METTRSIIDSLKNNQYVIDYRSFNEYDFLKGQFKKYGYRHHHPENKYLSLNTYVANSRYWLFTSVLKKKQITLNGCFNLEFIKWQWRLKLNVEELKFYVYVDNPIFYFNYQPHFPNRNPFLEWGGEIKRSFEYSGIISEEKINEQVEKFITANYIYPKGVFRDMQLANCCSKKKVKQIYKRANRCLLAYNEDVVRKWIRRKFNVESHLDINLLIKWVNKNGRQKKLVNLMKMDYSFMYDFEGNIDEAESVFWEEMNNYPKNTVLI